MSGPPPVSSGRIRLCLDSISLWWILRQLVLLFFVGDGTASMFWLVQLSAKADQCCQVPRRLLIRSSSTLGRGDDLT